MIDLKRYFTENLEKHGITLDDDKIRSFFEYKRLLTERNEKTNLTSLTEHKDVFLKHFVDSLTPLKFIADGCSVIDVGTGAGFPGLPLKIANPSIGLTLMDSLNKRVAFLNEVVAELGLDGVAVYHMRAEDGGHDALFREKYDFAVSRAVANLQTLCEYCLPFVKIGGCFIALKGASGDEELHKAHKAIEILGGKVHAVDRFSLSEQSDYRVNIVIKKVRHTPGKYPRKAGTPAKSPL